MKMETVKLSRIVMKFTPELYPFLRTSELDTEVVLRNGVESLDTEDVVEIIQHRITEYQKDALLH